MRKDLDEMYRLGLYGNGIERIKLKKAVQIIQKASASQVKIVDIGHDNFDSACEALELGSVDMAVVDMAQLIRMEKNDENLPYGVVISGVLKRGDSRYERDMQKTLLKMLLLQLTHTARRSVLNICMME